MRSVHKKRKLEQLAVAESCSSLATAWHDIDDIRRRVLSQSTLSTADLLRCELVCKHWRDNFPLLHPIQLSIKQQSHVAWLQHNVSRVSSLSVTILERRGERVLEYGTFGTCDIPVSQTDICSLQQLDHVAIAALLGEAKLATSLTIDGLHVKKLPDSLYGLTALQQLEIKGLPALLEVSFDVIAALTSLTHLSVTECCSLTHLGDGISKLTQLKLLKAGGSDHDSKSSDNSRSLYVSGKIGSLTGLQHLQLVHTDLPHTLVHLASLQTLELVHPHTPVSRLQSLSQLQCLTNLFLCTGGTSRDDYRLTIDLGGVASLERLIFECDELRALPDSTTRLTTLKHLGIYSCACLGRLPEGLGALCGLTHLTVSGSHPLDKTPNCTSEAGIWCVPKSLGDLVHLQELILRHCSRIDSLPESIGSLGDLKLLSLQNCVRLQELPESFSQLTALTHIRIDRCGILDLPELGQLKKLECMTLKCCRQLRVLPTSVGQLSSLKSLDVTACFGLKDLPNELGQLSAVRLCLKDCTGLKALPASVSKLEPDIAGCFGLLPSSFPEQPKFFSW